MNYVRTAVIAGIERVVSVCPLSKVPMFNPNFTPPHAYGAPDEVAPGWERRSDGTFAPPPPPAPEEIQAALTARNLRRLAQIDQDSIRPLRAIANGQGEDYDRQKLAALDAEAVDLRAELSGVEPEP